MKRSAQVVATLAIVAVGFTAIPSHAGCGGGRFSGFGGFGGSCMRGGFHRTFQRASSRPFSYSRSPGRVSAHRVYSQPTYSQPRHSHQPSPSRPTYSRPAPTRSASVQTSSRASSTPVAATQSPAAARRPNPPAQSKPAPDAAQSALDALASIDDSVKADDGVPQFQPAAPQADARQPHVGQWKASLPNDASVRLELKPGGAFRWVAKSRGKVSTFEGDYTVTDGRLTLVRSGDRQELEGAWRATSRGGYTFCLDGAKDGGLNFSRV